MPENLTIGFAEVAVGLPAQVSTLPLATTLTANVCAWPGVPVLIVVLILGPRLAGGMQLFCGPGVRAGLRSALVASSFRIAAWLSKELHWKFSAVC